MLGIFATPAAAQVPALARLARQSVRTSEALKQLVKFHVPSNKSLFSRVATHIDAMPPVHKQGIAQVRAGFGLQAQQFGHRTDGNIPGFNMDQLGDVLSGKKPLEELTASELESFYLTVYPALVVEGPYIPSGSQQLQALLFYHRLIFTTQATNEKQWAKIMGAVTNLGFLGKWEDAAIILEAATKNIPYTLYPWTDLIVLRALLNLDAYDAIEVLLEYRLNQRDSAGRPLRLSPAWYHIWEWAQQEAKYGLEIPLPDFPLEDYKLGYSLNESTQYWLKKYNGYNLIHLDFSPKITHAFLELRQGMFDKIEQDKAHRAQQAATDVKTRLQARLRETYIQARGDAFSPLNQRLDEGWGVSSQGFAYPVDFSSPRWTRLYPEMKKLSPKERELYLLIRHNLQVHRWLPKLAEQNDVIVQNQEVIDALKKAVKVPESKKIAWAAAQVPPDTQNLLVGDFEQLNRAGILRQLLTAIRENQPDRKIVLITPVKEMLAANPIGSAQLLSSLVAQHILPYDLLHLPLEQNPVLESDDSHLRIIGHSEEPLWASYEAIRLNNRYCLQQIEELRANLPDALFVIADRAFLVDKLAPYSLGRSLNGQKNFVALFQPLQLGGMYDMARAYQLTKQGGGRLYVDDAVKMKGDILMNVRVDKDKVTPITKPLSDVVGFDVRVLFKE